MTKVETAPMLRGVITQINGRPAREVAGEHWVLRGDRGVTYSDAPARRHTVTEGAWWPKDYDGPPQISFAEEEAEEMGLKLGERLTVNVLGRDIEAEITRFREVDFSTAGMGFVMTMNPSALQGAPHTIIATIYADPRPKPPSCAIWRRPIPTSRRSDARCDRRVTEALTAIAQATAWAAGATLLTGFVVLIGAAAAGERARVYEAAVLESAGGVRAGGSLPALRCGRRLWGPQQVSWPSPRAAGGWAVMRFVMEATYQFEPVSALAIVLGGGLGHLPARLLCVLRPLALDRHRCCGRRNRWTLPFICLLHVPARLLCRSRASGGMKMNRRFSIKRRRNVRAYGVFCLLR